MAYKYLLIQMNDPNDIVATEALAKDLAVSLPEKVSLRRIYLDR